MPDESENEKIPKPLAYIIAIAVVCLFLISLVTVFSGRDENGAEIEVISDNKPITPSNPSGYDQDAALAIFEKKITLLEKKNGELESELQQRDDAYKKLISEAKKDLSTQIQDLAYEVQESNRNRVTDIYDGLPIGTEDHSLTLDFDPNELSDTDDNPVVAKPLSHPYGKDYIILSGFPKRNPEHQNNTSTADVFDDIDTISNTGKSVARGESEINDPYASNSNKVTERKKPRQLNSDETTENKTKLTEIPATSFVQVTTLFGVNCPIGGQVVGSDSSIPPRPVVLPIRGTFYGPRNSTFDLGTAHIYGTCAARRTGDNNIGEAEIKINKISYWDKLGGSQWVNASGAIIDERDNSLDVSGYIDKVKSANIAKEAAAAAILAYSATLSSKEFVQTVGGLGGTNTALRGDELKAAGAQGVTALFKKYADRWENEANSAVDTVNVPAGIPLRFVTDSPILVEQAADPVELAYDNFYDVLL